nr:MAG TPA: hypothetical protein [Caudoviricetes sp.]
MKSFKNIEKKPFPQKRPNFVERLFYEAFTSYL